jgi:hypothetical protein
MMVYVLLLNSAGTVWACKNKSGADHERPAIMGKATRVLLTLRAKLRLVKDRCNRLRKGMHAQKLLLDHCCAVRDELERLVEELRQKKNDRENT